MNRISGIPERQKVTGAYKKNCITRASLFLLCARYY
jgi:hypothetical protein